MTGTGPTELESGGPERDFVRTSPPYFELPGNDTTAAPEHCVIDLLNSAQLRGGWCASCLTRRWG